MIKIADIKELKLNITWRMLYRGLLEKQISINEIVEYAMEQLEKDNRIEICVCDMSVSELNHLKKELELQ